MSVMLNLIQRDYSRDCVTNFVSFKSHFLVYLEFYYHPDLQELQYVAYFSH